MRLFSGLLILMACFVGCAKRNKSIDTPVAEEPTIAKRSPSTIGPSATPAPLATEAVPTINDPTSRDGDKTEADARAWLRTKIDAALEKGEISVYIMTTETGNPLNPKAAAPFKRFNPPLVHVFSEYPEDIHVDTIRSISIDHLVKLRRGEFCPLVEDDAFLFHLTVTGDKGIDRCVRSLHYLGEKGKAKRLAYRQRNGLPDVFPDDQDWSVAFTRIYSPSYADNVRKINGYREKK